MDNFYHLKSSTVLRSLIFILLGLLILNLTAIGVEYYLNFYTHSSITGSYSFKHYVTELFNFDGERNLPTYFSTLNFFIGAGLLFTISRAVKKSQHAPYHRQWYLMACVFVWLGIDELISLHELLVKPTRAFLKETLQQDNLGFLNFAWFVPYVLVFALMGLYLLKFVLSLPKKTLINFVAAGVIFLTGAVGMEMVGGLFMANQGNGLSLTYKLLTSFEEMLEMLGIIFFIYSLIRYIEHQQDLKNVIVMAIAINPSQEKQAHVPSIPRTTEGELAMAKVS
ncbi:hypothetical protein [Sabulibacter ruber]|uniref:hypothetical protein n=1 Tax=Sabulibacter ruber TaxID=2811901 RepID=UPI001A957C31|nr:hypothetical protein [Sabulibacter ruber]